MDDRTKRLHDLQMRDVVEMQAIYEAAAEGNNAAGACEAVLGNSFMLSGEVAAAIEGR
jgi:hypothetical protein